ncbi:DUF348 domain-containing protein [Candidatus Saccharibacteria bacterium TM7i]|nr:DUF348 domain-containing protein [Candidatus Saccharibacteria bacterium TM7i]
MRVYSRNNNKFTFKLALGVAVGLLSIIGIAQFVNNTTQTALAQQQGARLITLYDRGETTSFMTDKATIGEALEAASIQLDARDAVEPARDEKLVAPDYQVNVYRARPVTVIEGAQRQKVFTPYQSAERIVRDLGIALYPEDHTDVTRSEDVLGQGSGLQLRIIRAVPFELTLYGQTNAARTQAKTVGEMLKEKGVKLGQDDRVSVPLETPITEGMQLRVWREGKQTITVDEEVDFATEKIQDADREVGYKEVKTPGEKGERSVTYEVVIQDGKEVSRTEIASVTKKESKKQVEVVGTKMKNSFSGSFAEALARLRSCEGSYTSNTGNGYYGAYQYDLRTWGNYKGYANASLAPPQVQDEKAWITYQARGWQPWPSCRISQGLQDIYR